MNPTGVQDPNDILNAISTLGQQLAVNIPQVTLPSLNYTAPNTSDLDAKYKEFLDRASKDPDIVNYYSQLLEQAKGDTAIAQNFLENDYKTGVRNTVENLGGTLKQLGLTFGNEQNQLTDTLNKRGIALTQGDNGKLNYAGGGQSATELGQLNQSQTLRQEAETRSGQQTIKGLSTNLQKGLTSTGQQLTQYAQGLSQQKQGDIANRANTYYGMYQNQQASNLANAQMSQGNTIMSGGGNTNSGMTDAQKHINPKSGVWDDNYFASQH